MHGLLLWVVAVVVCRFPPSLSFFTRSAHPIEQFQCRRISGSRLVYISIYIYIQNWPPWGGYFYRLKRPFWGVEAFFL